MGDKQIGLEPSTLDKMLIGMNIDAPVPTYNPAAKYVEGGNVYGLNSINNKVGEDTLKNTVFGGASTIDPSSDTVDDIFSKYKTGIGLGLGVGQLGLGYLNYAMNKKGLESDLATAAQKRDLLAKAQTNRENIASKARNALRFG